jgi:hypothetical protein
MIENRISKAFFDQIKNLFIAWAGNVVTKSSPTREAKVLLYTTVVGLLEEKRFEPTFGTELMKRKELFLKFNMVIGSITDDHYARLLELFPPNYTDAMLETVWNAFKRIQTFCRNEMGPKYVVALKKVSSGVYDDNEILITFFLEAIKERVASNYYKKVKKEVADYRNKNPGKTKEEYAVFEESIKQERHKFYEQKLKNIDEEELHKDCLAFVLLSYPGTKEVAMIVDDAGPSTTKEGRRAVREMQSGKDVKVKIEKDNTKDLQLKEEYVQLKQKDHEIKVNFTSAFKVNAAANHVKHLLSITQPGTKRYRKYYKKYAKLSKSLVDDTLGSDSESSDDDEDDDTPVIVTLDDFQSRSVQSKASAKSSTTSSRDLDISPFSIGQDDSLQDEEIINSSVTMDSSPAVFTPVVAIGTSALGKKRRINDVNNNNDTSTTEPQPSVLAETVAGKQKVVGKRNCRSTYRI